jgi:hypothetical protein
VYSVPFLYGVVKKYSLKARKKVTSKDKIVTSS